MRPRRAPKAREGFSMYHLSENLNRIRLRPPIGHGVVMGDAAAPSIGDTSCLLPHEPHAGYLRVLAPHRSSMYMKRSGVLAGGAASRRHDRVGVRCPGDLP